MGRTQAAAIAMRVGVVGMVKFPSLAGVLLAACHGYAMRHGARCKQPRPQTAATTDVVTQRACG